MKTLSKKHFVEQLHSAHPEYDEQGAELVFDHLGTASAEIRDAAFLWVENGTIPDISAEGYDMEKLQKEFGMNPLASILTIDWLQKDPKSARQALKEGIQ